MAHCVECKSILDKYEMVICNACLKEDGKQKVTLDVEYSDENKFQMNFDIPESIDTCNDSEVINYLVNENLLDPTEAKHVVEIT